MSAIDERDPVPACEDAIQAHRTGEINWRWASEFDLDTYSPCTYCFGDTDSADDIDIPAAELIVTAKDGKKLHRHEDTGPVDYEPVTSTRSCKDLNRQLQQMSPDDLGLGGDA